MCLPPSQQSTTCQDETGLFMITSYLCLIFDYWSVGMTEKVIDSKIMKIQATNIIVSNKKTLFKIGYQMIK